MYICSETEVLNLMNRKSRVTGCILAFILIAAVLLSAPLLIPQVYPPSSLQVMDNLSISAGSSGFSILTLVAREDGFFANHGLNVTFTAYPSGIEAMDMLLANKADIAYAAEFVGVTYLLRSYDIRILGTVAKSEVISLVTRNDRNNRRHSKFRTAGWF